jgi:hypothetical protein
VKALAAAPRALTPLAVLAAVLALVVPSGALADRSDLLLALLVLATALGISVSDLAGLRGHAGAVVSLSVVPLIVLAPAAWLLGRPFGVDVRDGLLAVAALVYAALSGARGTHGLGSALVASLLFLAASGVIAALWWRAVRGRVAVPGALAIAMRDFAVAAALASQAFGSRADAVPGVYGVAMLLAGSAVASALARARVPSDP